MKRPVWFDGDFLVDADCELICKTESASDAEKAEILLCLNAAPIMTAAINRSTRWLGKMIADGGHLNAVAPNDAVGALQMMEAAQAAARGMPANEVVGAPLIALVEVKKYFDAIEAMNPGRNNGTEGDRVRALVQTALEGMGS